ncbi:pantetheine-phosphate adenylyltransferase [Corynebacterium lactis]|uniref:Phosphopantetheine adenylyltransferase n=1 Tax=Corynebacterium lactis RW2-5 TaxID=1408189 RepID=A0A0K2GZG6_9CORY|nr:pantetheine-phosphate adenylyltransferase [Corynebacterium lactis]ALA67180.1 phosphopantetheine adenylyltransferase [Corynebacterium lactis RW2-5]
MTHACCPGSYDPMTSGHLDIVDRASRQFDRVTVLVTHNPNKQGMFNVDERIALIEECTAHLNNVEVDSWSELLVNYTSEHDISCLVKGLRSAADYEYEVPMAQMNRRMTGIETLFMEADPRYGHVSSTLMKEVVRYGGSVEGLVPAPVLRALQRRLT